MNARAESRPVTLLADYRPYPFHLTETRLDVTLSPDATLVRAGIDMAAASGAGGADLVLDGGKGLDLRHVALNGAPVDPAHLRRDDETLTIAAAALPAGHFTLETEVRIDPAANTSCEGLYLSGGIFCTQCEAEGFRHITFYPDRPDVMTTFRVTMRGDLPVLLSNGNPIRQEPGLAEWHDPWPKPSYLFALVAGDLVAVPGRFTTRSGREVALNVWVRPGDQDRAGFALESLVKSMEWDEQVYGREYDLDVFNIVAVDDFNMGAMENKGLNIFNSKLVLASPDTATDTDYERIEAVIAHEYFHNWSGNRVTCRDWFQLSLKEGFTVLRDQLFSQDMRGEAVKRIEDVRILRAAQFPEDAGPLAHPIRPDSYREISNFYTATVYNKGAEVIRMMRALAGVERFRAGTDLYFARHDGEAATCEDFVRAIEEGAGLDLAQFRLWYSQAGTPRVGVSTKIEGDSLALTLTQTIPATPGQSDKQPMVIPLRVAVHSRGQDALGAEQLIVLTEASQTFHLPLAGGEPVLSINRGFTAPVVIERELAADDLVFLAARDDDPFARFEALQELAVGHLVAVAAGTLEAEAKSAGEAALIGAMAAILTDTALDDAMRGELMMLPSETYLFEVMATGERKADPGAIHVVREGLKEAIGTALMGELAALHARASAVPYDDPNGRGARKVKTQALVFIAAADPAKAAIMAAAQYDAADNMTDRQGALMVLASLDCPEREERLAHFLKAYEDNALVVDKWFTLQALSLHPRVIEQVRALASHPQFTIRNPNRVRSLHMAFAGNPKAFHEASGEGYRMIADLILELDPINPQTAARFVPALGRWRRIEPVRAALMKAELERIMAAGNLSRDTFEQVSRSLEE